jgi:hypothetical protein
MHISPAVFAAGFCCHTRYLSAGLPAARQLVSAAVWQQLANLLWSSAALKFVDHGKTASQKQRRISLSRVPACALYAGSHGGEHVQVEGSFDNWTTRQQLQRSGREFTVVKLLPPGVYQVSRCYRCNIGGVRPTSSATGANVPHTAAVHA